MKTSVIGAGGWGTAFARLLATNRHTVTLWVRNPIQAREIDRLRENRKYLPGVPLPKKGLNITTSLSEASRAELIIVAVPSFAMAELLDKLVPLVEEQTAFINLAKGIDPTTEKPMSELIRSKTGTEAVFTLSGPSHAEEVGRDIPTAVVLAGADLNLGEEIQHFLSSSRFRVYLTDDIRGVELCATVKNIIALASGVSDGLGYGDNSRGALISRGLAEMVRFGRVFGARQETFFGLSGLGDLVATCTSKHSRNRFAGQQLGMGIPVDEILAKMDKVVEGVYATEIVHSMARSRGIEMPITDGVWRLLRKEVSPSTLVDEIMARPPKREGIEQ